MHWGLGCYLSLLFRVYLLLTRVESFSPVLADLSILSELLGIRSDLILSFCIS